MVRTSAMIPFSWLALLSALVIAGGPAQGQIPGLDGLLQTPKITLGQSTPTADKVQRAVVEMEAREKELLKLQAELMRWKEQRDEAASRLARLEARKAELAGVQTPEGQLDPDLIPHLDAAADLESDLADALSFVAETYRQEQAELTQALVEARLLLDRLAAAAGPARSTEQLSLDGVLAYLEELRSARISLSLLKARRAGLNEELSQAGKEQSRQLKLPLLTEFDGDSPSRQETLSLRQEMTQRFPLLDSCRKLMRQRIEGHIGAQLQRVRVEIFEREEELITLEGRRQKIFDSLAVLPEELPAAQERLQAATERISTEERKLRRRIKKLRLSPPTEDTSGAAFTSFKQWQMELTVLQHRLYLLNIEQQFESFRAASLIAFDQLLVGKPAPAEFLDSYAWYLDSDRQARARDELSKRRDAWRQEYARLSAEEQTEGLRETAAAILQSYRDLLDLYDQIETSKWQSEWCAELVRHCQERFAVDQRDTLWYVWRTAATLLALLAAIVLSVLLGRWTLRPLLRRPDAPGWQRYALFATYAGSLMLTWTLLVAGLASLIWGTLLGFDRIGSVFDKVLFTIGDKEVTAYAFASLLGVIILTLIVARVFDRFVRNHIFAYFTWDLGIQDAVAAVIKVIVIFAGFVMGLEFVGIGFGVLALFAGVIGIGIGFGMQAMAANFIAGLTLLFARPIKKGDFVEVGNLEGRVESIKGRATTLMTRDAVSIIVPNSEFVGSRVVNWSHGLDRIRLHVPIGVAYGSDVRLVSRLLEEVGRAHPRVLASPPPAVRFTSFGDSSLNFELLVWTRDVELKQATISDINFAIDDTFRSHNISIPFPQRDIHIRSDVRTTPEGQS